jgi:hypothetical protein
MNMDEKSLNLWRQIERCRRIATTMTDDDVRHSLEHLAEEYESKLPARRDSFMLRAAPREGQAQPGVKRTPVK